MKPGLVVPPPYGEEWEKLIEGRSDKWKSKHYAAEAAVEERNELDRMHYIMHVTLSGMACGGEAGTDVTGHVKIHVWCQ